MAARDGGEERRRWGRARARAGARLVATLAMLVPLATAPVEAQDVPIAEPPLRVPASIDYVSVDGFYLDVGSDQGAVRGDTVAVYAGPETETPIGRLVLVSVTRRRSVAQALGDLAPELGDVLFLPFTPPEPVGPPSAAAPAALDTSAPSVSSATIRTGPRISGRMSLDLDARETRTSWGGDLFGEARRRFLTPTTRLSLTASELPGGLTFRTNVRAAYRYDDISSGPPPLSVRAYQAALTKEFRVLPVQITVGRFANPHEAYSAYWDGALLRVGGRSGGVGVVAGFEPDRYDEGLSTELPKLTGFADLRLGGGSWRYDTDVSVHLLRPRGGVERGYLGWSQRGSFGPLTLSQRLRLDGGVDGTPLALGQVRGRVGLRVTGALRLRATYGRSRRPPTVGLVLLDSLATPAAYREETTVGFDLRRGRAFLSAEGGRTRREGEPAAGLSVSGRAGVPLGRGRLIVSARQWVRGDARSTSVAPGLVFTFASIDWRTGYRLYRTDSGLGAISSQAVELQAGRTVVRGIHVTVRGEQQWGSSLSGTRIHIGFWRSL